MLRWSAVTDRPAHLRQSLTSDIETVSVPAALETTTEFVGPLKTQLCTYICQQPHKTCNNRQYSFYYQLLRTFYSSGLLIKKQSSPREGTEKTPKHYRFPSYLGADDK